MSSLDAFMLARMQFAANISFHILFPSISIALTWVLLFFKWRFHRTADIAWMRAYGLWVKIFALTFALGVVSGITMSFQFGTNWPGFMNTVGNIAGPLLAYEVLTAFFLEATFLGVMLFGRERVGDRFHTLATLLVAIGTLLSAFWILVLNSWMHTPAGFEMRDGVAFATDWWAIVFNPSLPYRFTHMLLASFLVVAFLIAGISAYRLLRKTTGIPSNDSSDTGDAMKSLRTGVVLAALVIPLQIVVGDLHGLNTVKHQPAKIAAIEAVWQTQAGAPMVAFAWPDQQAKINRLAIEIPKLASFILTHDWNGVVRGLNEFPDAHPPVAPLFFGFRVMVGVGVLMLLVSWWCVIAMWRKGITRRHLYALRLMTFSGWVALIAGWYVTEIGRQPWLVYGVLRTAQAQSNVPAANIGISLSMYLLLYAGLLYAYISVLFFLARQADDKSPDAPVQNQDDLKIGGSHA
jgi:cytochrome bd ubiquinol oxidase subunit I